MDVQYQHRCGRHDCLARVDPDAGPVGVDVEIAGMTLTARVALCPVHTAELERTQPLVPA